jgi:putative RNA-binding protein, YhbY family
MALSPKQRKVLKALAHPLEPTVRLGRSRLTDPVVAEANRTLEAHELIKIRIDADESDDRRRLATDLASATSSELVGTIGKIAILYRARSKKPKIRLP